jgi:hypothetical protein
MSKVKIIIFVSNKIFTIYVKLGFLLINYFIEKEQTYKSFHYEGREGDRSLPLQIKIKNEINRGKNKEEMKKEINLCRYIWK